MYVHACFCMYVCIYIWKHIYHAAIFQKFQIDSHNENSHSFCSRYDLEEYYIFYTKYHCIMKNELRIGKH